MEDCFYLTSCFPKKLDLKIFCCGFFYLIKISLRHSPRIPPFRIARPSSPPPSSAPRRRSWRHRRRRSRGRGSGRTRRSSWTKKEPLLLTVLRFWLLFLNAPVEGLALKQQRQQVLVCINQMRSPPHAPHLRFGGRVLHARPLPRGQPPHGSKVQRVVDPGPLFVPHGDVQDGAAEQAERGEDDRAVVHHQEHARRDRVNQVQVQLAFAHKFK